MLYIPCVRLLICSSCSLFASHIRPFPALPSPNYPICSSIYSYSIHPQPLLPLHHPRHYSEKPNEMHLLPEIIVLNLLASRPISFHSTAIMQGKVISKARVWHIKASHHSSIFTRNESKMRVEKGEIDQRFRPQ